MPSLLFWMEDVSLRLVCVHILFSLCWKVLEYMLGVQEFGVNILRSKIFSANYEYFCGDIPKRTSNEI